MCIANIQPLTYIRGDDMIDVTGGGKVYGINRPINEIIINDKPWEELRDEAGYIKKFADFDGDKVDLKLGCKELDRDLYTGLIETTDGRKWIRKYSPPYPLFIQSGTGWIYIGVDDTYGDGMYYYKWVRFRENVYICFVGYSIFNSNVPNTPSYYVIYVSDHPVEFETFTAYEFNNKRGSITVDINKIASPEKFGATISIDPLARYMEFFSFDKSKITLDNARNIYVTPGGGIHSSINNNYIPTKDYRINNLYIFPIGSGVFYPDFGGGGSNGPYIIPISTGFTTNGSYNHLYYSYEDQHKASLKKIYKLYNSSTTDERLYLLDTLMDLTEDIEL